MTEDSFNRIELQVLDWYVHDEAWKREYYQSEPEGSQSSAMERKWQSEGGGGAPDEYGRLKYRYLSTLNGLRVERESYTEEQWQQDVEELHNIIERNKNYNNGT